MPNRVVHTGRSDRSRHILQLISMEEGRIPFTPVIGTAGARLNYDYFIKDHPNSNTTALSQKLYKFDGVPIALGITLKVMAGDQLNIFGKSKRIIIRLG